jgi:acyl-CoA thioesterase FadM
MKNYVVITPRFSDFNGQALLKASIHLDLACEAQLAQMAPRYNLPLQQFVSQGLRWHIADFKISYDKVIRGLNPLRIEADVIEVSSNAMLVEFGFFDEQKSQKFAYGTIRFDLVDAKDQPFELPTDVRESLVKNGRVK